MTTTKAITPSSPLNYRIKWLIGQGCNDFRAISYDEGHGITNSIIVVCPHCPDPHVVEDFPTFAEAEVALELALHAAGFKIMESA